MKKTGKPRCYWCAFVMGKGKESEINGKIYKRDIKKIDPDNFGLFWKGEFNFHKDCLILQIKRELELETNEYNRRKERLLKEIQEVEAI